MLVIKNLSQLEKHLENDVLTVLVFYAKWCEKGNKMLKKVQVIEKKYQSYSSDQLCFARADIDTVPGIKEKYQVNILPATLILKDKMVHKKFYVRSEEIMKNIEIHLLPENN